MKDAREKMLKEIQALEFMEIELNLYLNTHPYDQQAFMIFRNTVQQRKMLRDNYERMYGPLTAFAPESVPVALDRKPLALGSLTDISVLPVTRRRLCKCGFMRKNCNTRLE